MLLFLGSMSIGAGVAAAAYSSRDYYDRLLDHLEQDIGEKLRRLRTTTKNLRKYLILWSVLIVLVFLGFWLVADSIIFGVLIGGFLACAPWYFLNRKALLHKQRIEEQLSDAMVTFASGIRAGLSIAQAMEILADQCPRPLCDEFRQIVGEYRMGKPLEQIIEETKARLRSENFSLFSAALMASREAGGKLNEIVERISSSIVELGRLERKVQSETAQARKSAVYMALVPPLILTVYYFVDQESTTRLFTTVPGNIVLAVAILLNVLAYLWARVILSPDI